MKKNLGRGLASLMGSFDGEIMQESASKEVSNSDHIYYLSTNKIYPNPNQPRKNFDEEALQELANSIKKSGIISPIIVKKIKDKDGYEIIAGERRFRAARYANIDKVPAIIKDLEEKYAFEIAVIENIQRQNLNAVEEAKSYQDLMKKYKYSQHEVSVIVGKSRSHIANFLRLLNLPESILKLLAENKLTMGHARALIGSDHAEEIADLIVKNSLSVRETEKLVRSGAQQVQTKKERKEETTKSSSKGDIKIIEDLLRKKLSTDVYIKSKTQTKGTISVDYNSLEQLDKILQLLGNAD